MPLVSKPFGDIITFTRATSATFTGSNGLIQSAGVDVPRFDYDPVTLAAKGLLIEEQRTNLCLYSGGIGGTGWTTAIAGTGVTPVVTTNFAVAPDGTTTASRIQVSLGGGTTATDTTLVFQGLISASSSRGSFYIKTNDGSSKTVYVRGQFAANFTVDGTWRRYDFDAGTLAGAQFGIGLRGGQTPTNDNTADLLVWGAQLELGSFATSYIPTVASQVTRSADVASVNTLSPWYNATEGTIYCEGDRIVGASSRQLSISDGTSNNFISLYSVGSDALQYATGVVGGVTSWDLSRSPVSSGVPFKQALGYSLNNVAFVLNGGSPNTDITATSPTVDRMLIGQSPAGTNAQQNQHIRRITYYPRRLSNAELQTITA